MTRLFWAFCLFVFIAPFSASADDEFCATAPFEMLPAVGGQWTLTQGAGYGVGSILPFPLPPHRGQSVVVELDEDGRLAYLKHDGQKMAMVPVPHQHSIDVGMWISDAEVQQHLRAAAGCDWDALPTLIGSNKYELNSLDLEEEAVDPRMIILGSGSTTVYACDNGQFGASKEEGVDNEPTIIVSAGDTNQMKRDDGWQIYKSNPENRAKMCDLEGYDFDKLRKPQPPREGEMVMQLMIKFDTPSSGAGVLQFQGQFGQNKFMARAPVTLTR